MDIGKIGQSIATQGMGMIFGKSQDKRQLKQQEKLQKLQMKGAKEMSEFEKDQQMDMWNKTNYGAQKKHMEDAGLNAGLMYGMGGGGGVTTGGGTGAMPSGGNAEAPSAGVGMAMQLEMMKAQKEVLESQSDKNRADAEKTRGVDTQGAEQENKRKEFDNEVNKLVGTEETARSIRWAQDKLETESKKQLAEFDTWQATAYEGKPTTDENSPLAKAYKAGLQNTLEQLKSARIENNIKRAEVLIREFEAELTKTGIPANSPWYVKIMNDLIREAQVQIKHGD